MTIKGSLQVSIAIVKAFLALNTLALPCQRVIYMIDNS